jgi:hypothetical protein
MALQLECKRNAVECLYGDSHEPVTQVLVDAHALVRANSSCNSAKLGEQLRRSAVAKTLGVISEP